MRATVGYILGPWARPTATLRVRVRFAGWIRTLRLLVKFCTFRRARDRCRALNPPTVRGVGAAHYCSLDCLRVHWREHKKACPLRYPIRRMGSFPTHWICSVCKQANSAHLRKCIGPNHAKCVACQNLVKILTRHCPVPLRVASGFRRLACSPSPSSPPS